MAAAAQEGSAKEVSPALLARRKKTNRRGEHGSGRKCSMSTTAPDVDMYVYESDADEDYDGPRAKGSQTKAAGT
jgi:hypothetical protein